MRNILLFPVHTREDDLNKNILRRLIKSANPLPPPDFEDHLIRLDEAEENNRRKEHVR